MFSIICISDQSVQFLSHLILTKFIFENDEDCLSLLTRSCANVQLLLISSISTWQLNNIIWFFFNYFYFRSVQYLSSEDKAHVFAMNSVPARLSKKVTLLDYFSTYMDEHLIKVSRVLTLVKIGLVLRLLWILYQQDCLRKSHC